MYFNLLSNFNKVECCDKNNNKKFTTLINLNKIKKLSPKIRDSFKIIS